MLVRFQKRGATTGKGQGDQKGQAQGTPEKATTITFSPKLQKVLARLPRWRCDLGVSKVGATHWNFSVLRCFIWIEGEELYAKEGGEARGRGYGS